MSVLRGRIGGFGRDLDKVEGVLGDVGGGGTVIFTVDAGKFVEFFEEFCFAASRGHVGESILHYAEATLHIVDFTERGHKDAFIYIGHGQGSHVGAGVEDEDGTNRGTCGGGVHDVLTSQVERFGEN